MKQTFLAAGLAASLALAGALPARAQEPYKIGVSAGLTGYAATVDRAWRDGVELAAAALNAKGGVMGRKIQVIVEDNRSEPQEAVTVYRKMLSSDKVDVFVSGCVSAGNFAAAGLLLRAKVPMMLCSILPTQAEHLVWAFSTLPPAGFEVDKRLEYLKEKTQVRKIAVLHDPTPYANLQKSVAERNAAKYGLEVVSVDQYKQDDADLSVQISKARSAGAGAILKIGLGGTTLTAAKNIKQLGADMLLLTSLEDLAVFGPVAEVLGQVLLRRLALAGLRGAARRPAQGRHQELPRSLAREVQGSRPELGLAGLGRRDADGRRDREGEVLRGREGPRRL